MMSTPTNVSSELGVVRRYGVGQPAIRAIAQDPRHRLPFLVSERRLVPFGARHAQPARLGECLASAFDCLLQCRVETEGTSSHDLNGTPASLPRWRLVASGPRIVGLSVVRADGWAR